MNEPIKQRLNSLYSSKSTQEIESFWEDNERLKCNIRVKEHDPILGIDYYAWDWSGEAYRLHPTLVTETDGYLPQDVYEKYPRAAMESKGGKMLVLYDKLNTMIEEIKLSMLGSSGEVI